MSEYVISSVTVEIEASARAVWAVLVDFAHYPQWNPYTVAVATEFTVGAPIDLTLPARDGSWFSARSRNSRCGDCCSPASSPAEPAPVPAEPLETGQGLRGFGELAERYRLAPDETFPPLPRRALPDQRRAGR